MKKLWKKNWELNPIIEFFETKDDLLLDQKLIKFDVFGSLAHSIMLKKIGIISTEEYKSIFRGLIKILDLDKKGLFLLQNGDEDIHTKIENFLTEEFGEAGKKIHTGRSRNDQVLTAIRLYAKEELILIWNDILNLTQEFLNFGKKYEFTAMPGFTHMQKAMPSSIGIWSLSFVESFFDDLKSLKNAYEINNQSPLGSAAGYGVPLNLERELTSSLLGFGKVQANSLYCQNSRGKIESLILSSLITLMLDINKFSSDILLFTTSEFDYFELSEELFSGSSIMPQKKNLDIAELLRSKVHLILGNYVQIVSLSSNLISGYNRDFQDTKKPFMESLEIVKNSLKIAIILIRNLKPKKNNLKKALTPEIFAAHNAYKLVKKGIPFRQAYQDAQLTTKDVNLEELLKQSTHTGGTGNLKLDGIAKQLKKEYEIFRGISTKQINQINKLINIKGDKNI